MRGSHKIKSEYTTLSGCRRRTSLLRLLVTSYLALAAVGRKSSDENRLAASNSCSFYPVRKEGEVSGVCFAKFLRVVGSPSYSRYALLARFHASTACIAVSAI
jgi:hypothetical protein